METVEQPTRQELFNKLRHMIASKHQVPHWLPYSLLTKMIEWMTETGDDRKHK